MGAKTRNAELFKKICSTMAEAGFVRTMEQKQAEQLKKWTRSDQLSVLRDYGRPLGRIPLSQAGQLWVRVRDRDRVRGSWPVVVMGITALLVIQIIWIGSPTRAGSFNYQTDLITTYTFYNSAKCSPFWLMICMCRHIYHSNDSIHPLFWSIQK